MKYSCPAVGITHFLYPLTKLSLISVPYAFGKTMYLSKVMRNPATKTMA